MSKTSIEWTDHSINPIRARLGDGNGHYCEKISPGCKNCYASRLQPRFRMPVFQEQRRAAVEPYLHTKALEEVLRRRKPTRYFWCDMTDLFGHWVPNEWIAACFGVMAATPQHTHQILTKRPKRALEWFRWLRDSIEDEATEWIGRDCAIDIHTARDECSASRCIDEASAALQYAILWGASGWPLPNVWVGVSAEDQQRADERHEHLRQIPAAVRFYSVEPLLSHIPRLPLDGISWVIVGGESGSGARPMHPDWARSIRDQCVQADVPFFFKQWGAWCEAEQLPEHVWAVLEAAPGNGFPNGIPSGMIKVGKKHAGRLLDGRTWDEMPNGKTSPAE